ncbi:ribosome biogenesis GTPase Der [Candidatus Gracilibacteria bacterium]|nr:ribosome biogenesis GTPase Der [Candidatus Gracilibacteria bacterium]
MDPSPAKIAIIGRPNVGKSTLFNRLIGKRHAIIADEAGTTRDQISQKFECQEYKCILIDTGGLEYGKQENIEADVQSQANIAIGDADLILFVIDAMSELTVDDFTAASILRKSEKPVVLIANKCDNESIEENSYNIYELGFGEPIKISAIHKLGIDELNSAIVDNLKKQGYKKEDHSEKETKAPKTTSICILGKPNAGKSSLVNGMIGMEKVIVSEIAGTTRDVTDTEITYNDEKYNLIDTAGIRRRGKVESGIEKFSVLRCLSAIERSDIVVLLIDGELGITAQDCHIAEFALQEEKGLILAVNKIDLMEDGDEARDYMLRRLIKKFAFAPWAPVVFISAKNRKNIFQLLELSKEIMVERNKRIDTGELNAFLQKTTMKHLPASAKNKKPRFFYGTQVDTNPPKFVLFFKNPKNLHFSYPRYLENEIRKNYGFGGTAINLTFKNKNAEEN